MNTLQPNQEQQNIVNCIEGPVIVIACPGAGKTTTLLERIRHMTEVGISEENILMVTFSKNAAKEMKSRYVEKYNTECKVTFKTLHALCFSILKYAKNYKASDIISEDEARDFIYEQLTKGKNYIEDSYDLIKSILTEISCIKNNYIDISNYEAVSCETDIFLSIFDNYEAMLKATGKIDYDNMLIEAEAVLHNNPKFLTQLQNKFQYIQCDEYQDTNTVQKNILYLLSGKNKNLCVVGDDDQSIYMFRGANPKIMFDFQRDFPECKTFYIGTNYRSGQNIVDIASEVIKDNTCRFKKSFISDRGQNGFTGEYKYLTYVNKIEELQDVVNIIKKQHSNGVDYKDIAILFRTNNLAQGPMEFLMNNDIPFRTDEKAKSLYDKWLFKLVCNYIRCSTGNYTQQDVNAVLSKPNKYLKIIEFKDCPYERKAIIKRLDYMGKTKRTLWQKQKAVENIITLFNIFAPGRFHSQSRPIEVIRALEYIGITNAIREHARKRNEDYEDAYNEWIELTKEAHQYRTLEAWMQHAYKDKERIRKINEKRKNIDGVNILTIHSAKGCEWKTVFVIDVNDKVIPHKRCYGNKDAIEEERRLLYVAMTRAKDSLYVMCSGNKSPFIKFAKIKQERPISYNIPKASHINSKPKEIRIRRPKKYEALSNPKYGTGVFKNWEGATTMIVQFGTEEKMFNYPSAIKEGFLSFVDE